MAIINKRLSINLFILNVRLQLFGCAIDEGPVVKYFHYSCVVSTKSEIRDSVLSYIYWIEFSFWIERERERWIWWFIPRRFSFLNSLPTMVPLYYMHWCYLTNPYPSSLPCSGTTVNYHFSYQFFSVLI